MMSNNQERMDELTDKRLKVNEISSSFCAAKWLQQTLYLNNGFNHSCHHPSPHKIPLEELEQNIHALHNSNFKKEQRAKMLRGERPKECEYCWKIEDLGKGYFSDRHLKSTQTWAYDKIDEIASKDPYDDIFPTYLEVSLSNACNFACAYCSPEISSKWMEDIKKNGEYPTKFGSHNLDWLKSEGRYPYDNKEHNPYVEAFYKWFPLAFPHLRVFRITGGEPTMAKEFWRVMDMLKENLDKENKPRMRFAVSTNLCTPDKLIDRLIEKINAIQDQVIEIQVFTSAEATGKQNDYVRDGMDYELWLKNCNRILDETKALLCPMTTINLLSLPSFTGFIDDVVKMRGRHNVTAFNRLPFSVNYLRFPPHLQTVLLDKSERQEYADEIQEHCEKYLEEQSSAKLYLDDLDQIKRFCDYLRTEETQWKYRGDFAKFVTAYDTRRGKNFKETFPEFAHLVDEWKYIHAEMRD